MAYPRRLSPIAGKGPPTGFIDGMLTITPALRLPAIGGIP
jgi:hypothetical protein